MVPTFGEMEVEDRNASAHCWSRELIGTDRRCRTGSSFKRPISNLYSQLDVLQSDVPMFIVFTADDGTCYTSCTFPLTC